jgi:ribosomal protein S19
VRGRIFFLDEISSVTPNMVSVRLVKNGKSHSPIGGISVAVKSAKGEIRVSENRTLGLQRCMYINSSLETRMSERRTGRVTTDTVHNVYIQREPQKQKACQKTWRRTTYIKPKLCGGGLTRRPWSEIQKGKKSVHVNFYLRKSGLLIDTKNPFLVQCSCRTVSITLQIP